MSQESERVLGGYLRRAELAKELGKTARTLERWERERTGPPVTRVGRVPLYSIESTRHWLKSREAKMVRERS